MSNKNEIKNPKFAVAIDHTADYSKKFTHYALESTDKAFAFMEAMQVALKAESVYCFHVIQRVRGGKYKSLAMFHKDASGCETNEPWLDYFTFDNLNK